MRRCDRRRRAARRRRRASTRRGRGGHPDAAHPHRRGPAGRPRAAPRPSRHRGFVRAATIVTVQGMAQYREGQKIKAIKVVHRSSGSAWPGTTGKIVKITGDGYTVRWDNGGWHAETVKDNEIERAG